MSLTFQRYAGGTAAVNKRFCFSVLLLFCLAAALLAWGRKEESPKEEPPKEEVLVQVSGRVRLVGNEPFPELVISGTEGEWFIDRDEMFKLFELQQRTVTIEGIESVIELTFAGGRSAGVRRFLKDIEIISIEE